MGACETTPTTTRDPGNQPSDLRTRQPAGTPQAVPPQPGDQVTGSIQHCLLTTKAPMGAVLPDFRVIGAALFYRHVQGKGRWMGSLIEELKRQEEAARAEADRLRSRIEELTGDLARAEEQASRLVIAREEVTRVLGEPAAAGPSAGRAAGEPRPASPIGAVTVLPWQEGADAAGLPTEKAKVEGLRSKLRLLAARGWLAPAPGGLFTLPDHSEKIPKPGQ